MISSYALKDLQHPLVTQTINKSIIIKLTNIARCLTHDHQ